MLLIGCRRTTPHVGNDLLLHTPACIDFPPHHPHVPSLAPCSKHQKVWRYTMPVDEVVETAKWAYGNGIHTVMLQSGEVNTPKRYSYLVDMVRRIREETIAMDLENLGGMRPENTDSLGIVVALSAGELPTEVMKVTRGWERVGGARWYASSLNLHSNKACFQNHEAFLLYPFSSSILLGCSLLLLLSPCGSSL